MYGTCVYTGCISCLNIYNFPCCKESFEFTSKCRYVIRISYFGQYDMILLWNPGSQCIFTRTPSKELQYHDAKFRNSTTMPRFNKIINVCISIHRGSDLCSPHADEEPIDVEDWSPQLTPVFPYYNRRQGCLSAVPNQIYVSRFVNNGAPLYLLLCYCMYCTYLLQCYYTSRTCYYPPVTVIFKVC